MYNSLPLDSKEKLYISEHCAFSLKPLIGDIGLSIKILSQESINNSLNTYSFKMVFLIHQNIQIQEFMLL